MPLTVSTSNKARVRTAIALACLLGSGTTAFAQKSGLDIHDLASQSKFVVHSRVSAVEYRMSESGAKGQAPVPHTIVTYEVVRPLQGSAGAASFSLRYIGGPDGRGRFLGASNVPVFQVGDEDILFVRDNGANGCPLAGCIDGRLRLLNGAVHDGTGAPVQGVRDHQVLAGGAAPAEFSKLSYPTPSFDELMRNPEVQQIVGQQGLTLDEARRRYEEQAPAKIEMTIVAGGRMGDDRAWQAGSQSDSGGTRSALPARTMTADSFEALVVALPAGNATTLAFQSVDAQERIATPAMRPAVLARSGAQGAQGLQPPRSAADLAEERALPKDDPTITRNKAR